ncbi:MAG: LytR/AlgR family response regulator transcription factor [Salibacteraceae bacterium]
MQKDSIRAMIIDDEEGARESLSILLEKYVDGVKIVAKADSIAMGMEKIKKYTPDLVFLDIEMPFGSGFELLNRMKPINFDIIFVTAYDHYALKAIKFSALDYLLKPVDIEELKKAVDKHKKRNPEQAAESYQNLVDNESIEGDNKKLAIPDSSGIIFVPIKTIIRCESDGNYTKIFLTSGKKILASKTLGEYESMLDGDGFFRVHRSHLINLSHLKKYNKGEHCYVELGDGTQVDVSRRKKSAFMEALEAMNS